MKTHTNHGMGFQFYTMICMEIRFHTRFCMGFAFHTNPCMNPSAHVIFYISRIICNFNETNGWAKGRYARASVFCRLQPIMPTLTKRICIYTKDIQRITGRSERYARQLLGKIRQANRKDAGSLVTVKEFCWFTKIGEEEVEKYL